MATTELSPSTEQCTASIHLDVNGCEAYSGPLLIGFYPESSEVWVECEGHRINIPAEHFKAAIKQLQRAHRIAADELKAQQ